MTRLSQVVRGVEEKAVGVLTKEHNDSHMFGESNCPDCIYNNGYNRLASAEVVVDREKMKEILSVYWGKPKEICNETAQAIATVIESGEIISLKGDK